MLNFWNPTFIFLVTQDANKYFGKEPAKDCRIWLPVMIINHSVNQYHVTSCSSSVVYINVFEITLQSYYVLIVFADHK